MNTIKFVRRFLHFFNLESELENLDVIHEEIRKGVIFKGTNLWILIFAIIVASVGLNMNSTAVIIGAMLISPLMGPINGMGYSIATFDFELFRMSVKNYTFAVLAGLLASTAYFAVSPVSTAHSELLARTSPTIYDVLIALFGGLAGIVAICSRLKGNVIPGVAIATALMPPLCTAGYGLATGQFNFFFGAMYLFTINTIFIALAAVWFSQILNFPIRSIVDEGRKKRINRTITLVITIVLLPSIYFGYQLIQKEKFIMNANKYIANISLYEGNFLLKHSVDGDNKTINLVYGGNMLSANHKEALRNKSRDFDLINAAINIEQGLALNELDETSNALFQLKEEVLSLKQLNERKQNKLDSIANHQMFGKHLLQEIKTLFPEIIGCTFADGKRFDIQNTKDSTLPLVPIVILEVKPKTNIQPNDKIKLETWLYKRLHNSDMIIIFK
jgi:uncharacterized hydrophobic protein (TIGR00271 family)